MNFGKYFAKTIYEGKIGILEGLEETLGGRREKTKFRLSNLEYIRIGPICVRPVENKISYPVTQLNCNDPPVFLFLPPVHTSSCRSSLFAKP
jgi:hypothetical protein